LKDESDDEEDEKENAPEKKAEFLGRGKRNAVLDSKLRVSCYYN